jgi:hypothetical protein
MHEQIGKILIIVGSFLLIAGIFTYFLGNKVNWLGHLPGDIRIEKDNIKIFIPITSMILLSLLLTLLINFIKKLF